MFFYQQKVVLVEPNITGLALPFSRKNIDITNCTAYRSDWHIPMAASLISTQVHTCAKIYAFSEYSAKNRIAQMILIWYLNCWPVYCIFELFSLSLTTFSPKKTGLVNLSKILYGFGFRGFGF